MTTKINFELLNKTIKDSGLKKEMIADKMGITSKSLKRKISGEGHFIDIELMKIKEILNMTNELFLQIFFAYQVTEYANSNKVTA